MLLVLVIFDCVYIVRSDILAAYYGPYGQFQLADPSYENPFDGRRSIVSGIWGGGSKNQNPPPPIYATGPPGFPGRNGQPGPQGPRGFTGPRGETGDHKKQGSLG